MLTKSTRLRRGAAACAFLLVGACTDRNPLATVSPEPEALATVNCRADVRAQTLSCAAPVALSGGARKNLVFGGQEMYVKLSNAGTTYDAGTETFETMVTVQNLLQQSLGTDGTTTEGVKVFFFTSPAVTSGTGTVEVANPSGTELFMGSNQPYFLYPQVLAPYEISAAQPWRFSVPSSVNSFQFTVYVSAPVADEDMSMLDRVWTGMTSSFWSDSTNWRDGLVPDATSTVGIFPDSLIAGAYRPALDTDVHVLHLRVGPGSTLNLDGHTLRADGNVDAAGALAGGTLWMAGSGAMLHGNVDALRITGDTKLQATTRATGAVAVQDGSLSVRDQVLSISIP